MTHTAPTLSTKFARRLGFVIALVAFAAMVVAPGPAWPPRRSSSARS